MSFLCQVDLDEAAFPPFAAFRKSFGFIPNLFRAQTLRPDVIRAEVDLLGAAVVQEGALSRRQKEYILLVCSAANLNTYCVTVHSEIVRILGFTEPDPEEIANEHHETGIPVADKVLLDFALKLAREPGQVRREDVEALHKHGFSDPQILEAIVVTALSSFFNLLASGLGAVPDSFPNRPAPASE